MITKEGHVEIEVLRKHGFSLRKIAAEVGCAVNTVRSHLAQGSQPSVSIWPETPTPHELE